MKCVQTISVVSFVLVVSSIDVYARELIVFEPTLESITAYTMLPPIMGFDSSVASMSVASFIDELHKNNRPNKCAIYDATSSGYALLSSGVYATKSSEVMVFSRGYAKIARPKEGMPRLGGGVFSAYEYFKAGVIHVPCVTFDYPDDRHAFNFGQDIDQQCMRLVLQEVRRQHPDARITVIGDCRGSLSALRFAASHQDSSDFLVLMSPFLSAYDLADHVAQNYLPVLGSYGRSAVRKIFSWWFSSYDPTKDVQGDTSWLSGVQGKVIFIAHRLYDKAVPTQGVYELVRALRSTNTVYLFLTPDTTFPHSKMNELESFQCALNAFFKHYGLAHDPERASRGEALLEEARKKTLFV